MRDVGSLGIRSLSVMNLCLLVKWWWRFGCANRVSWKDIFRGKYNYATNGWLHLLILKPKSQEFGRTFCLQHFLTLVFLFYTSRMQLFAWEMDECSQLIHLLHCSTVLSELKDDKLVWKAEVSGLFTVKSIYDRFILNLGPLPFVPRAIWMNIAPSKMQFTCWLAWKGRLKASVFLHSIGVLDPTVDPLCIFCNSCDEDVNRVILHCSFAWKIWTEILSWWGIIWVVPQSVSHLLEWWDGFKFKKLENSIWGAILAAVIWNLWKARNGCKFASLGINWEGL
ncbi:uncharacterized protein LOC114304947 [Camellia sinensis]|uniref:uncharacterized protein LOC114304947 n=1 Tax=Camellia sinensis TaxID=4442 RepID=UPI0010368AD2|nr:uncharacterized protein LOC114304947 [Camellia sinensis]